MKEGLFQQENVFGDDGMGLFWTIDEQTIKSVVSISEPLGSPS